MKLPAFCVLLFAVLPVQPAGAETWLDLITLPAGFRISIYADRVENTRQMTLGDKSTQFVGSRRAGKYRIRFSK